MFVPASGIGVGSASQGASSDTIAAMAGESDRVPPSATQWNVATWPNLITLIRLSCLPIFLWLLLGKGDRAYAGWLLGILGATDWVDGWVARRFNQVSEFGKMFDPTADRLLFIVSLVAIMVDGAAPSWFCILVLIREVGFGITVAVCTLFFGMERFDVTYLGKWATFILMFAVPGFVMGSSDIGIDAFFSAFSWVAGPIGLLLSYYTAFSYVPTIRTSLAEGRKHRGNTL